MKPQPVFVAGSGAFLPGAPIPFDRIDAMLGEPPGMTAAMKRWLDSTREVLGQLLAIRFVHYAIDWETREFTEDNVTMAVKAARIALASAGMQPDEIDLICYGSAHQDQMPTASVRIQEALGIERCDELAIHANCTSAYKALYLAHQLIGSGRNRSALVLSANIASSELRAEYYNPAHLSKESLFLRWFLCDGAGALILTADPNRSRGFEVEESYIESIGGKRPSLMFNKRPSLYLNPQQEFNEGRHHLCQNFRNALAAGLFQEENGSIFRNGFERMARRGKIPIEKIKIFQINLPARHIVESVMDECVALGVARESFYSKLDELGYCGPPMALICLDKILREESFAPGDRVVSFVTEVSKFMQAGYSLRYVG